MDARRLRAFKDIFLKHIIHLNNVDQSLVSMCLTVGSGQVRHMLAQRESLPNNHLDIDVVVDDTFDLPEVGDVSNVYLSLPYLVGQTQLMIAFMYVDMLCDHQMMKEAGLREVLRNLRDRLWNIWHERFVSISKVQLTEEEKTNQLIEDHDNWLAKEAF